MTSCGYVTLVILSVLLRTIDLSQGDCFDILEDKEWLTNSTLITLITTKDSKDMVYCTLERECNVSNTLMCAIKMCFEGDQNYLNETCQEKSFGKDTVPLSHFLCLVAKILNHTIKECGDYGE
ncbi:uncharacterized protein FYW49_015025 [Xenentodon cancila]